MSSEFWDGIRSHPDAWFYTSFINDEPHLDLLSLLQFDFYFHFHWTTLKPYILPWTKRI